MVKKIAIYINKTQDLVKKNYEKLKNSLVSVVYLMIRNPVCFFLLDVEN